MIRLLVMGLTFWGFAFLLAARGEYVAGLVFAALGAIAFIGFGVLLPSEAQVDARRRNPRREW